MSTADITKIVRKLHHNYWTKRHEGATEILSLVIDDLDENTVLEFVEVLGELSTDDNWRVRKAAVEALIHTNHPAALPVFDLFSGDSNREVRTVVKQGVKRIRQTMPTPKIQKIEYASQNTETVGQKPFSKSEMFDISAMNNQQNVFMEAAHAIAGKVNVLLNHTELMYCSMSVKNQEKFEDLIKYSKEDSEYLHKLVNSLHFFTESSEKKSKRLSISDILKTSLELAKNQAKTFHGIAEIRNDYKVGKDNAINGDVDRLEVAFRNLMVNAMEAMPDSGSLMVEQKRENDEFVLVTIVDSGLGMDNQQLAQACQPFKTTKRKLGKIGIGLTVAEKIISNHGGKLKMMSSPENGTTVVVRLPLLQNGKGK